MFRLIERLSVKPDLSVFQNSTLNNSKFNIQHSTLNNSKSRIARQFNIRHSTFHILNVDIGSPSPFTILALVNGCHA